ncbi:OprD family porin [Pseudomonas gingeri]|uniref:OprD family porin n=1 Tax=Pseudomonas gingeri TaxID=117681 RepID=UPI0015A1BFA4|nr:OprD family porin [Pseudomonas gingeri]NVZ65418.1 OprD family porin [Pseudomonas gingeri]NVZ77658.1 OprD family porin [Pseudomonas gingeri]
MRQHNKISRALQPTLFGLSLLSLSLPGLSFLGLAVAQPVCAEGFIDDAKARLDLRNVYFNQDNRSGPAAPSKLEEWGQGFILNFTSGYTQGPVGFGVDALGMLGVRLDSGRGTHGNPNSVTQGGFVFPTDSSGRAVDDFATLGLTGKVRIAKTELKAGTLLPRMPILVYNDGRLLPETFQGVQVTSRDFDHFTLTGGQVSQVKSRNSSNNENLAIAGAGGPAGQRSNKFNFAGVDYQVDPSLLLQYYYGNLEDFYQQHFLGLVHTRQLPVGSLKTDLRFFDSSSDGLNGTRAGRQEGYLSSGYHNNGEVDNRAVAGLFTYSLGGHAVSLGYQHLNGSSDFPFLNQGDGSATYLITDRQTGARFQRAGENTWVAQYGYNFASLGLQGLTTQVTYQRGGQIKSDQGDQHEWERDLMVSYAFQSPMLRGFGMQWRNAMLRSTVASQRDLDENRVYLTYTVDLF